MQTDRERACCRLYSISSIAVRRFIPEIREGDRLEQLIFDNYAEGEDSECMKYNNLGRSGLRISRIALGMMSYGDPGWRPWIKGLDESRPFVKKALELGINFFDTADMYSNGESEVVTGRLLKEMARREEVVVSTKVFFPDSGVEETDGNDRGLSRKHIFDAIDRSLKNLGMDYVDLYQIHRWDSRTPIEETMEALHDVVKAGKARYIGASSMWAWQLATAQETARRNGWTPFISMQNHYNLMYREEEREMIPYCRANGLGIIPWSPLARGLLAGNRKQDGTKHTERAKTDKMGESFYGRLSSWPVADRTRELADELNIKPAQVALAWHFSKSEISAPIIGATKPSYLDDAVGALEVELSSDQITRLEELYTPQWVSGH